MTTSRGPEYSCGDAGDRHATINRLIHAGLANNDQAALKRARQLFREFWPSEVADAHFALMVEDAEADLSKDGGS